MTQDDLEALFGPAIHTYTEEDALEDGALVHPYPERFPWLLITDTLNAVIKTHPCQKRTYDQKLVPLLLDCVAATRKAIAKDPQVDLVELDYTIAGRIWIRPNSMGGMTVMLPEDN